MDEKLLKNMLTVHKDLPQEGPGSGKSTARALKMIPDLPADPQILDIGCGPGRQTIDLAENTGGVVTAIDIFDQYLDQLRKKAKAKGLSEKIRLMNCSMDNLPFSEEQFDLVWSEGAAYLMGFEKALSYWKKFLKPKGCLALTEVAWIKPDPPEDLRQFWHESYPAIKTIEGNIPVIEKCGCRLIGHFTLPESDWWQYYKPLKKRIESLKKTGSPELMEYIKSEEAEMELYNKYSKHYGYEFFVMQKES